MRIAIVSRIFDPEPSAASFRLKALAEAFVAEGHQVTVLTVKPRPGEVDRDGSRSYSVRRFPVLRDKSGYVRGYLQYLSFDVPLFFRLLLGRTYDLIVSEPPPTTGFFVRIAATLRQVPFAYYAADIWSDASSQTGAPAWVVGAVRWVERFALKGASRVLSVSEGVTNRLTELGVGENVTTIGNGVDVAAFAAGLNPPRAEQPSAFVYAGTASEWHGAGVFVEALPQVLERFPGVTLRFIGGGSERAAIENRAADLGVSHAIKFEAVRTPGELAPELASAIAAVASVRPGCGYDFAFPTKLYSGAACGAPLLYAGQGPGAEFVRTLVEGSALGWVTAHEANEVAEAMCAAAAIPFSASRRHAVAAWAAENVSLSAVAGRAVATLTKTPDV